MKRMTDERYHELRSDYRVVCEAEIWSELERARQSERRLQRELKALRQAIKRGEV